MVVNEWMYRSICWQKKGRGVKVLTVKDIRDQSVSLLKYQLSTTFIYFIRTDHSKRRYLQILFLSLLLRSFPFSGTVCESFEFCRLGVDENSDHPLHQSPFVFLMLRVPCLLLGFFEACFLSKRYLCD